MFKELDEEREASSSAASEVLSRILLHLQGENIVVEMQVSEISPCIVTYNSL